MDACGNSKYAQLLRKIGLVCCSIPWCCMSVLVIAACTGFGVAFSASFDAWFHRLVPFFAIVHAYNVIQYIKHKNKTRGQTIFFAVMTALFIASVAFHITDWHDSFFTKH